MEPREEKKATQTTRETAQSQKLKQMKILTKNGTDINIQHFKRAVRDRNIDAFIYLLEHADDKMFIGDIVYVYHDQHFLYQILNIIDPLIKDGILLTTFKNLNAKDLLNNLMTKIKSKGIAILNLKSEADISKLSDIYVSQAKDLYVYPIEYVYDPIIMIKYGFFPLSIDTNEDYFIDYVNSMPIDTIEFWYNKSIANKLLSLIREPRWIYKTLETHKRNGIELAISLPLILYAPELVYKQSKRPVNDMSLFRGPLINKVKRSDIINNTIVLSDEQWKVIPVTRYASGMSKGLYFTEIGTEYCGTFYYYEPESTTLLAYKTSESHFNKYTAVKALLDQGTDVDTMNLLNQLANNRYFMAFVSGVLPKDLMLTPTEYISFITQNPNIENPSIQSDIISDNSKHYVGTILSLYALEDGFDQPLCELGRDKNLSIIILESMIGSHQVVTEVLDTRPREESFRSLVYIVD